MLTICKTCLLSVLDEETWWGLLPSLQEHVKVGTQGNAPHVFTSSTWQVRVAFWLKCWVNLPLLQYPDVMAKAPKGSGRKAVKAAQAAHACSVFQEAPHSRCLCPCWCCTAVPAPAMALPPWAGTSHLSHVPLAVEEDEVGRPDWVCSCCFIFSNAAEALSCCLQPAYRCARLSQCWQALWSWVSSTATNLRCWVWTCLF